MEKEAKKELTKEGFERLLTKAAQPIRKQPSPEVEKTGEVPGGTNRAVLRGR